MNILVQKNRNSCFYNEYDLIINKFFLNTFRSYTEIRLKNNRNYLSVIKETFFYFINLYFILDSNHLYLSKRFSPFICSDFISQ